MDDASFYDQDDGFIRAMVEAAGLNPELNAHHHNGHIEMVILTTYFNPCGYANLRRNYWHFRRGLGVPLYTIELSFDDTFEIPDAIHLRGGPENLLWQKERLLNIVARAVPDGVAKVAWIDADILFLNPGWFQEACRRLDEFPVVQLFEKVHFLDSHYRIVECRKGVGASVGEMANLNRRKTGHAWAARRELFPLIDDHVVGGADTLMVHAWLGQWKTHRLTRFMSRGWHRRFVQEGSRQYGIVRGSIGYVSGDVIHLYHGERRNRKYDKRHHYLTDHNFDPDLDLAVDNNGLWKWASDKPQMHRLVAEYFAERKEDKWSPS